MKGKGSSLAGEEMEGVFEPILLMLKLFAIFR